MNIAIEDNGLHISEGNYWKPLNIKLIINNNKMKTNFKFKTQLIAFAYVLLVAVLLIGCETRQGERNKRDGYSIIEIDNCQYIEVSSMIGTQSGYYSLTHKGNCKFCLQRLAK